MLNIIRMLILACIIYLPICPEQKNVTIWIHGTMVPLPKFAKKSYFHLQLGLTHIQEYSQDDHLWIIAKTLHDADCESFNLEHYYTFGWSGALGFIKRKQAAEHLYQELQQLIASYVTTYGERPCIRIIAHSHGGNVVLHVAQIKNEHNPLCIDEIILLATPVQEETKHLINSDCFEKVYVFYSRTDLIQIIDPQGLYRGATTKTRKLHSERQFDFSEKLRQAAIKIHGHSLMHIDFIRTKFLQYIPKLCKELDHFCQTIAPEQKSWPKVLNITHHQDKTMEIHKQIIHA